MTSPSDISPLLGSMVEGSLLYRATNMASKKSTRLLLSTSPKTPPEEHGPDKAAFARAFPSGTSTTSSTGPAGTSNAGSTKGISPGPETVNPYTEGPSGASAPACGNTPEALAGTPACPSISTIDRVICTPSPLSRYRYIPAATACPAAFVPSQRAVCKPLACSPSTSVAMC